MNITDSYCTPLWLALRVGRFDTDPCSNPRSHIEAIYRYMLETGHDGLKLPWLGRTWLNHPYSDPMPWMQKLGYEMTMRRCTEAVVLPKVDHSTEWWQELVRPRLGFVCDEWKLHKRVQFDIPPDVLLELQAKHEAKCIKAGKPITKLQTSNNFCSSIIHWHMPATAQLELADVATLWVQG